MKFDLKPNSNKIYSFLLICLYSISFISCANLNMSESALNNDSLLIANLKDGKSKTFEFIRSKFKTKNKGYDMDCFANVKEITAHKSNRTVFIQQGGGTFNIGSESSKFSVGDIIMLKPDTEIKSDSLFSAFIISTPDELPSEIPTFIRPDWDENITDTPGGCATETNAYRRILLTWKNTVGPYVFHSVNAHRVRIMNSFSHYHPKVGGFDEFYLVQMAAPTAKIIISNRVSDIEGNQNINQQNITQITQAHSLKVGDLVYLPRGLMHRGVGNVLAQVITVPGFIPGAEIGLDHHLLRINQNLKLSDKDALPYNEEASTKAIIK